MKSPTDELLSGRAEAHVEPQHSGLTGGLELYDQLIDFLGISLETPPVVSPPETMAPPKAADSGPLPESGDVIKITGPLSGFAAAKAAESATVNCGDCGNRSDSGELFCIHCGGLLEQAAANAEAALALAGLCDECGALAGSDDIFCPSCGSVMSGA